MDDIAHRAGVSKKTLYQHFANKEEVVKESLRWYKTHMSENCEAMMKGSENAVESMVRLMALIDEMHKRINPMAMFELKRHYPETYNIFREQLLERDIEMLRDNIITGMKQGVYRENLNADLLARYRLETSLLILQPNLIVNERSDLMNINLVIGEHFLYGIMTPKGEELYKKYKEKYLKK